MSTPSVPDTKEKTPTEAAGYIAGTLTGAAQMVMPVRMWITLLASVALIIFVFQSESLLNIARAFCVFASMISVLIGSAVYSGRSR
ncbi:MAG: hypothetical protein ACI9MB_002840 [Verrucomicrobiales bacterium]|jgi:hypothetical protein